MTTRHIAALAVWLVVVGLLVFGAGAAATLGRPIYWTAGLLGGLALLSAISSLWSGSVELSVIEADRVLAYLGIYLAAFLIAQTDLRRQRFAEGLAIAFLVVALLALASRLLPHVLDIGSLGEGARLYYPLEYWNADGTMFGIAVATLLWMSRRAAWTALRWISVAAIPAVLLALYFTYSRGGLLALLISAGILIALSRDRLWLTATLAIGALGALPALLAVQSRGSLADNVATQAAVDQGVTVLLILLAGVALATALFAGLRALERREGELTGRAVELSRHPRTLKAAAAILAVIAIGAAVAVGGRAWDQFKSSDVALPEQPSTRFSNFGGTGRSDFWRVAIDSFEEEPLIGTGAGTYQFDWEKRRSIYLPLHDAHSLYLESFAELGVIGGVLVLALVGGVLWWAFCAWRDAGEDQRELHAIVFAALVAMAVAFGIDWFWEILAMGSIFFIYVFLPVALAKPRKAHSTGIRAHALVRASARAPAAGIGTAGTTALTASGPPAFERTDRGYRCAAHPTLHLWSGAVQEASTPEATAGEEGRCYRAIGRSGDESFSTSNHLVLSSVAWGCLSEPLARSTRPGAACRSSTPGVLPNSPIREARPRVRSLRAWRQCR